MSLLHPLSSGGRAGIRVTLDDEFMTRLPASLRATIRARGALDYSSHRLQLRLPPGQLPPGPEYSEVGRAGQVVVWLGPWVYNVGGAEVSAELYEQLDRAVRAAVARQAERSAQ